MTIYDIAKLAGVSPRTVTRAFQSNSRISKKTRETILKLSEENGYRPNALLGRLRGKILYITAVSVGPVEIFMGHVRRGFAEAAESLKDYKTKVAILRFQDMESFAPEIPRILEGEIDGLVVASSETIPSEVAGQIREKGIPVMTVLAGDDSPSEGKDFAICDVSVDTEMKGRLAGNFLALIRPGGRYGIFTGDLATAHHRSCLKGFREEAEAGGAKCVTVWDTKDDPDAAARFAGECMAEKEPYDGIFFASANSVPALERFRENGYRPAIVASDVFPRMSEYLRAGIVQATIFQDPEEQGKLAVTSFYSWLAEDAIPDRRTKVPPQLVLKADLPIYEEDGTENRH